MGLQDVARERVTYARMRLREFVRGLKATLQVDDMSHDLTERQAFLVLNALPNIGPVTLNRLLE